MDNGVLPASKDYAAESEKVKKELGEKVVKVEAEKAKIAAERDELVAKLAEVTAERDGFKAKVEAAVQQVQLIVFVGHGIMDGCMLRMIVLWACVHN